MWCAQLSDWYSPYDTWTIPHQLLPFFLTIYGINWYYVVILIYLWETSEAFSMCHKNSFTDESIDNMLISDPLMAFVGIFVAVIILWKGEALNKRVFVYNNQETLKINLKRFLFEFLEIALIVSMSFIISPALIVPDAKADEGLVRYYCLGLSIVYLLLAFTYNILWNIQTVFVILYFITINLVIFYTKTRNSMWLAFIIGISFGISAFFLQYFKHDIFKTKRQYSQQISTSQNIHF